MRAVFGVIYFVGLYWGALQVAAWGGTQVALKHTSSQMLAQRAGKRFAAEYHAYIMAGTGVLTIVGCGRGLLPGTRTG